MVSICFLNVLIDDPYEYDPNADQNYYQNSTDYTENSQNYEYSQSEQVEQSDSSYTNEHKFDKKKPKGKFSRNA